MLNPTPQEKMTMNYEYTELLTSLLLAHYFGSNSDVAIRQCAKRVSKRLSNPYVLKIAKTFREVKSPFTELEETIKQIEDTYPITEFMRLGILCGQPMAVVKEK